MYKLKSYKRLLLILFFFMSLVIFPLHTHGSQLVKLLDATGTSPRVGFGKPKISSNGQYVVYTSNSRISSSVDLFSLDVNTNGSPVQLSVALSGPAQIGDFSITSDSASVVYLADRSFDRRGRDELFSVPIARSSPPIRLSALTSSSNRVSRFLLSSNAQRAVYLADQSTSGVYELYSVNIAGGGNVKLNSDLSTSGQIDNNFVLSSDGQRVIYLADVEGNGSFDLFSVAITGGEPDRIAKQFRGDLGSIASFELSELGNRVLFAAMYNGKIRVFSASVSGDDLVELQFNADMSADNKFKLLISPNGKLGAFLIASGNSRKPFNFFTFSTNGIRITKIDDSDSIQNDINLSGISFSPDSLHLVYVSLYSDSDDRSRRFRLFSVDSSGSSSATQISQDRLGRVASFTISPDSTKVVYVQTTFPDVNEGSLFSVSIGGGTSKNLSRNLRFTQLGTDVYIKKNNSDVIATLTTNRRFDYELYGVGMNGVGFKRLNGFLGTSSSPFGTNDTPVVVTDFTLSEDERVIIFRTVGYIDQQLFLYRFSPSTSFGSPELLPSLIPEIARVLLIAPIISFLLDD